MLTDVRAFGVDELRALQQDPTAALDLEMRATDPVVNGEVKKGTATIRTQIVFGGAPTVFGLVRGGWLPMPLVTPPRFLLDRNVLSYLARIRDGKSGANEQALLWWMRFFEQGDAHFNPLPYAYEGSRRRKPTMDEFVATFELGARELKAAFPSCSVVEYGEEQYQAAYRQLEAFEVRDAKEKAFLVEVAPLVANRLSRAEDGRVKDQVLRSADRHQVARGSLISLAVLSCVYEDVSGRLPAVGRGLLKPKPNFGEGDAFNAISDIRHVELAAAGRAYFGHAAFSLCTCDRALAMFWSALQIEGDIEGGLVALSFNLTSQMLQRLTEDEVVAIRDELLESQ